MAEYLIFESGDQTLGVPVECVLEVVRAATLSNLEGSSKTIEGILNLRGNAVPVLNLTELLKVQMPPLSSSDYLLVMSGSQMGHCAVRSNSEVRLTSEAEIIEYDGSVALPHSRHQRLRVDSLIIPLINPDTISEIATSVVKRSDDPHLDLPGDSE